MKKYLLFLLIGVSLFSCKKDSESISSFEGTWTGSYTSTGEHGTFQILVAPDGKVSGTATSEVFDETFQVSGIVNPNGNIALTFGTATSRGTFTGTMNKTTASGTWENKMTTPNYSGTWTGKKM